MLIINEILYKFANSKFIGTPLLTYITQLPNVFLSLGVVLVVYKIGNLLFTKRYVWLLTILVSMWPQFSFVISYSYSEPLILFAISILFYVLIYGKKQKWNRKSCVLLLLIIPAIIWLFIENLNLLSITYNEVNIVDIVRRTYWLFISFNELIVSYEYIGPTFLEIILNIFIVLILLGFLGLALNLDRWISNKPRNKVNGFFIAVILSIPVILILLSIDPSGTIFQDRGRYLLPLIIPICIIIVEGIKSLRLGIFTNIKLKLLMLIIGGILISINYINLISMFIHYYQ